MFVHLLKIYLLASMVPHSTGYNPTFPRSVSARVRLTRTEEIYLARAVQACLGASSMKAPPSKRSSMSFEVAARLIDRCDTTALNAYHAGLEARNLLVAANLGLVKVLVSCPFTFSLIFLNDIDLRSSQTI